MNWLCAIRPVRAFGSFAVLDPLCAGLGTDVPVLCILPGFPVGWCIARTAALAREGTAETLSKLLRASVATAAVTFVIVAAVWGRCVGLLFDPAANYAEFGIPFMLYNPKASLIGWLVPMILVSPFMQLLTTLFASHLAPRNATRDSARPNTPPPDRDLTDGITGL